MHRNARQALGGLCAASALAGAAVGPASATTTEGREVSHCTTPILTPDQIAAGAQSVISCSSTFAGAMAGAGVVVPADAPLAEQRATALASGVVAMHHDLGNGGGDTLSITGAACNGGGISLSATDPWNDKISSTRHRLCTQVKHWVDANYAGSSQLTEGADGTIRNLNGTLSNQVSSIRYY